MNLKNKDKLSYSIGQVAAHTGLPQSVLRYWETVFPQLAPSKSPGGSRQYSDSDISIIRRIKELLYDNGFTIKGANFQLEKELNSTPSEAGTASEKTISKIVPMSSTEKITDLKKLSNRLKDIIRILED